MNKPSITRNISNIIIFLFLISGCKLLNKNANEIYFNKLYKYRSKKKEELTQYLNFVQKKINFLKTDKKMHSYFIEINKIFSSYKSSNFNELSDTNLKKLNELVRERYIYNYLLFYDLLFINKNGDIFHTIRKDSDLFMNIFNGNLSNTNLSKYLSKNPLETFIDFENYEISGVPSAFFVEPILENSTHQGWIVCQFTINRLNHIFSLEEGLGTTGETFIVNKNRYMLTDSKFLNNSTILKMNLSAENINSKFQEGEGKKIVTDYRGYRALTSFQVFPIVNNEWLIISKIDEDEVITEFYKKNRKRNHQAIIDAIKIKKTSYTDAKIYSKKKIDVNMDDFKRAGDDEILYSYGISSCVAVIITVKGKFAYMAHVSPYDWIYGGKQTDLVKIMLKRINDFELAEKEKRKIEVVIITPNIQYKKNLTDVLIDNGIFLSQIKKIENPDAKYANIYHDYIENKTVIDWKLLDTNLGTKTQLASDVENLGMIMKKIMNY